MGRFSKSPLKALAMYALLILAILVFLGRPRGEIPVDSASLTEYIQLSRSFWCKEKKSSRVQIGKLKLPKESTPGKFIPLTKLRRHYESIGKEEKSRKLKGKERRLKNKCVSLLLDTDEQVLDEVPSIPAPVETPILVITSTPVELPRGTPVPFIPPTPTATPSSTPVAPGSVELSKNKVKFLSTGGAVVSLGVRGKSVSSTSITITTAGSGFRILSSSETIKRGGIPCDNLFSNFCVIYLERVSNGSFYGSVTVNGVTVPVEGSSKASRPSGIRKIRLDSLASNAGKSVPNYLEEEFNKVRPFQYSAADVMVFDDYSRDDWSNTWFNSQFDLSGIAWDAHQAGTAITPCHLLVATHYGRGGGVTFTRKNGSKFSTSIVASRSSNTIFPAYPQSDVTVLKIAPCLPEDIPVYPLVDSQTPNLSSIMLNSPYVNTHYNNTQSSPWYKIRKLSFTRIQSFTAGGVSGKLNPLLPAFLSSSAVGGDSGNPSFVIADGELVLTSTFTFGGIGGGGPNLADSLLQSFLESAVNEL